MYPNLSQSFTIFHFMIFVILHRAKVSSSASHQMDPRYENCMSNSSSCVASVRIAYPFWGNGHLEHCGHLGFELSCDANNNLTINIMAETYYGRSINYNRSKCPEPRDLYNTTLDLTLFNYTSNVKNAPLFYDYPAQKIDKNVPFGFFCPGKYWSSLSYFVITQDWEDELDEICGVKVYVPIFKDAIRDPVSTSMGVDEVLKKGFEVRWVVDERHCQQCSISGGCCGYNMALGQSTCFCDNGAYSTICPASTLSIAAAAGGLFFMSMLFLTLRSSKDYYHSSSMLPSEISANGQPSTVNVEEKSTYFGAHLFSYKELERATNNFEPSKELGRGGFGTVYHGKLQDRRDVAIKRLYKKHNKQLYGCTPRKSRQLLLVYEYVPNGTIADHLHGKRAKPEFLHWPVRLRIAIETASALVYLHAFDIIHRDVKTKNILLDANYSVKVADFGLSRLFPLDVTHVSTTPQGSPGYVDPEYHQSYQLTDKSDVYSFGVVLAELLSAKPTAICAIGPRNAITNSQHQSLNLAVGGRVIILHLTINRSFS
ncbi:hypothetical protein Cgig2_000608 [Carnegiea gigantea]|uniref:non-specific serine/threonine protein kinase n=1 Tax=Carnegiea gigantea TaxID=171969 RepID=A0A9Q1JL14_9CARY|nr:hypothetical protein Cgig2_000608 [Carnegiea gigantea]